MTELEKKILALQALVEEKQKRYTRSIARTTVIYVILFLLVLGYTTFLYQSFKSTATPEALASLVVDLVRERMPDAVQSLRKELRPAGERLGKKSVDTLLDAIPQAGNILRDMIGVQINGLLVYVEDKQMPVLYKLLDEQIAEALKAHKQLKDEKLLTYFPAVATEKISEEMRKAITGDVFNGIQDLEKQLQFLRNTPNQKLLRRQYCEKMLIVYWVYLCDQAEVGSPEGSLASFAKLVNHSMNDLTKKLNSSGK
ncbi:MAG: hypothetical protein BWY31_00767 [Lentisphaerae bacterium ADurb.Bin242]|nr:MAG: hypothetical protein BWY31_00767 [Lentisphaerae bacterium ADurb.Bin242]